MCRAPRAILRGAFAISFARTLDGRRSDDEARVRAGQHTVSRSRGTVGLARHLGAVRCGPMPHREVRTLHGIECEVEVEINLRNGALSRKRCRDKDAPTQSGSRPDRHVLESVEARNMGHLQSSPSTNNRLLARQTICLRRSSVLTSTHPTGDNIECQIPSV